MAVSFAPILDDPMQQYICMLNVSARARDDMRRRFFMFRVIFVNDLGVIYSSWLVFCQPVIMLFVRSWYVISLCVVGAMIRGMILCYLVVHISILLAHFLLVVQIQLPARTTKFRSMVVRHWWITFRLIATSISDHRIIVSYGNRTPNIVCRAVSPWIMVCACARALLCTTINEAHNLRSTMFYACVLDLFIVACSSCW
jgi:hypothetical protein